MFKQKIVFLRQEIQIKKIIFTYDDIKALHDTHPRIKINHASFRTCYSVLLEELKQEGKIVLYGIDLFCTLLFLAFVVFSLLQLSFLFFSFSRWYTVCLPQGSALLLLLFAIVVDFIAEKAKRGVINDVLYANDLVLVSETMEDFKKDFEGGRKHRRIKQIKV